MASINGISVKKLTHFLGHEGEDLYQGSLYLNNKKIGFWSQDSWGGPDRFLLDSKYGEKLLNDAVIALNPDKAIHSSTHEKSYTVPYDLELLLNDYLALKEDEKAFQTAVKSGYKGVLIASDGFHQAIWSLPEAYSKMSDGELRKELNTQIENARSGFLKETPYHQHTIKIYRTPADFTVGEPIKIQSILSKKPLNSIISQAETQNASQSESRAHSESMEKSDPEL